MLLNVRKLHRIIGIILLLPFLAWAITGFVFFVKPGYTDAYDMLIPKTYPLDGSVMIASNPAWLEVRFFRTILGNHLTVRTDAGWIHLDPTTLQVRRQPTEDNIKLLLTDAFSSNPRRYGHISRVADDTVWTDTGVKVILDWNTLSLQQRGKDTDRIDFLYKVHYLQWTGMKNVDRVLGIAGLLLLVTLTVLGARLALKRN
jgi:hypothetical protein